MDYNSSSMVREMKLKQQHAKIRENQNKKYKHQIKSLQPTANEISRGSSQKFSLLREDCNPLVDDSSNINLMPSKFAYDGPESWDLLSNNQKQSTNHNHSNRKSSNESTIVDDVIVLKVTESTPNSMKTSMSTNDKLMFSDNYNDKDNRENGQTNYRNGASNGSSKLHSISMHDDLMNTSNNYQAPTKSPLDDLSDLDIEEEVLSNGPNNHPHSSSIAYKGSRSSDTLNTNHDDSNVSRMRPSETLTFPSSTISRDLEDVMNLSGVAVCPAPIPPPRLSVNTSSQNGKKNVRHSNSAASSSSSKSSSLSGGKSRESSSKTGESDKDKNQNTGENESINRQSEIIFDPIVDIESFVKSPAPENCVIKCRITRHKGGVDRSIYPSYSLHLERKNVKPLFLLAARRRKKSKTSNYLISCDATDMKRRGFGFLAKLRSNFVGTQFTLFDNGEAPESKEDAHEEGQSSVLRKELAAVIYDTNLLGFKGPRKMTVVIPGMTREKVPINFQPNCLNNSLVEKQKRNEMDELIELHNKRPVWNEESQSYVLNFHGRVTQASVKNFQIVHDNDVDYIVMQFGRTSVNSFTMDYSYPLSAVQAFGIALSSFDGKLACE